MSKAEQFIQDCTRNCSNEIEWSTEGFPSHDYALWVTPLQALRAVEIEREEMIKKVCNFVAEKLFVKDNVLYTNIKSKIVEDIKQAMEE